MPSEPERAGLRSQLLDVVPCIDPYCDKHGNTMDGPADDPQQAQCQFCYEVRFPLVDDLMQLFEATAKEVIKVPPCNCKHARQIVGEQRHRLAALIRGEGEAS